MRKSGVFPYDEDSWRNTVRTVDRKPILGTGDIHLMGGSTLTLCMNTLGEYPVIPNNIVVEGNSTLNIEIGGNLQQVTNVNLPFTDFTNGVLDGSDMIYTHPFIWSSVYKAKNNNPVIFGCIGFSKAPSKITIKSGASLSGSIGNDTVWASTS